MRNTAITKVVQDSLTPDAVLNDLIEGNQRFINNNLTATDHNALVQQTIGGQFPKAAILSCIDSRVPVEYVFDQHIGDIFVARVAGNFENEDTVMYDAPLPRVPTLSVTQTVTLKLILTEPKYCPWFRP